MRFRTELISSAFTSLIKAAADDFPDAVDTALPFLRPVLRLEALIHSLQVEYSPGQEGYAKRFPEKTLTLLDALIADDRLQSPYGLAGLLEVIAEAQPTLRHTGIWHRLYELTL